MNFFQGKNARYLLFFMTNFPCYVRITIIKPPYILHRLVFEASEMYFNMVTHNNR